MIFKVENTFITNFSTVSIMYLTLIPYHNITNNLDQSATQHLLKFQFKIWQ